MPKPLAIMLTCALLLSGCANRHHVAPALPICPEPITLPRSMTDPLPRPFPIWFVAPAPTMIGLSAWQDEQPRCTPTGRR